MFIKLIQRLSPKRPLYAQILFTVFAFFSMTILSYAFMSKSVRTQLIRNTETVLAFEQAKTESDVLEHAVMLEIVSHTARNMVLCGDNAERLQDYFNEMSIHLSTNQKHIFCFMGISGYFETLPDGPAFIEGFIWNRPDNYIPYERQWYLNAVATGGDVAETLSYSDIVSGETVLNYSQSIYDDLGQQLGVVILRIRMAALGKEIVETALSRGGYGMLISKDLIILAHPNADFIGRDMRNQDLPVSIFTSELESGLDISERSMVSYTNEDSVAFFRKLPNGWYLGLVTPKRPYYQDVRYMAITLGVIGLVFSLALVYFLIHIDRARKKSDMESRHKSAFLANMSHEIRTPMNAIIGMTTLGKSSSDIERKDYCFQKIDNASNHLLGVINDILDMSKIEANKFNLAPEEFNFEKMLQRIVNVVNFRVEEKKQKLSIHIDKSIPETLIADDLRLAQVITNLLGNAVKFTPEEGSIRLETRFIEEAENTCVIEISVSDTGIGIDPDKHDRLFDSFEQAESSTTRRFGGTGLGLAISKSIVEMMGGKICLHSEQGKGSTFTFTIKAKRGTEKKQELLSRNVNWDNIRIMAVDDDPDILDFFREITNATNIFCDTALNATAALRLAEQNETYHIYFVDWKMPGMDGIQLASKLKEKAALNSVVIMISAAEWTTIEEKARKAGVNKFIAKPLFPSSITDAISETLGLERQKSEDDRTDIAGIFTGRRILLAEDVEINREIVLALLEPTQLEIDTAENGIEAVNKFSETPEKYEMVFMDLQMPGLDGYEATRRIRALETKLKTHRQVPIIALTANVFREDIEKCLEAGMNDHLGKPLNFNEVLEKLNAYLCCQSLDVA